MIHLQETFGISGLIIIMIWIGTVLDHSKTAAATTTRKTTTTTVLLLLLLLLLIIMSVIMDLL